MNRGSRAIVQTMTTFCDKHGIEFIINNIDIMRLEDMMIDNTDVALNMILQSRLKTTRKATQKNVTLSYWLNEFSRALKVNKSAKRQFPYERSWLPVDDNVKIRSFDILLSYMPSDYGYKEMCRIQEIINKYDVDSIQKAVKVATSTSVYNIDYIFSILEKNDSIDNIKSEQRKHTNEKMMISNDVTAPKKNVHTIMDMALIRTQWDKMKVNSQIDKDMEEAYKKWQRK